MIAILSARPPRSHAVLESTKPSAVPTAPQTDPTGIDVSTKPVDQGRRGPREFTGVVDLTRDKDGHVRARLLELVPGNSGEPYTSWLKNRGQQYRSGVEVATLDPFHGYRCAIDDQLEDAIAVLDASSRALRPAYQAATLTETEDRFLEFAEPGATSIRQSCGCGRTPGPSSSRFSASTARSDA